MHAWSGEAYVGIGRAGLPPSFLQWIRVFSMRGLEYLVTSRSSYTHRRNMRTSSPPALTCTAMGKEVLSIMAAVTMVSPMKQ